MTKIVITCPVSWFEQCKWIKDHCKNYEDTTNWGMWQIGQDDIYFTLEDKDAFWFNLRWSR